MAGGTEATISVASQGLTLSLSQQGPSGTEKIDEGTSPGAKEKEDAGPCTAHKYNRATLLLPLHGSLRPESAPQRSRTKHHHQDTSPSHSWD